MIYFEGKRLFVCKIFFKTKAIFDWFAGIKIIKCSSLQVTILNESHYPDWDINEFRMMRGDTVRTIRHFHFTTWPDFGVPEPPQTLVRSVLEC